MKLFYLINDLGAQVGVVHARSAEEAIDHALDDLGVEDLDHLHEAGNTPMDCLECIKIRRYHGMEVKH